MFEELQKELAKLACEKKESILREAIEIQFGDDEEYPLEEIAKRINCVIDQDKNESYLLDGHLLIAFIRPMTFSLNYNRFIVNCEYWIEKEKYEGIDVSSTGHRDNSD